MFLALVSADAKADPMWRRVVWPQVAIDVLGTGLLLFALGRALSGWAGGLLAVSLFAIYPLSALLPAAVLTECLAAFLTTAVIAIAILGRGRSARWLFAGGVVLALLLWVAAVLSAGAAGA